MLSDLTDNFIAKKNEKFRKPIQIAVFYFNFATLYLSDRDITVGDQDYVGLIENWGELSTVGAENAVSSTQQLSVTLWNGAKSGSNLPPFSQIFLSEDPINTKVEIYQGFVGLSFDDFAKIGDFVIQDPVEYGENNSLLVLDLVSENMRYFGQVGEMLTKQKWPNALESDLNSPVNLIVGDAGEVRCLCIDKPPRATVKGSFLRIPTRVYAHEDIFELGFTPRGSIQIDDEILYYTSRTSEYFEVRYRGHLGTKAVDHSDGAEIVQYQKVVYMVGQGPISQVLNVKSNGQDPLVDYTVKTNTGYPYIEFERQPTYVEFSRGARTIEENFDSKTSANTAAYPHWAYDPANKSAGAILDYSKGQRLLSVIQEDEPESDGQLVKIFLVVEHWATKKYYNDEIQVVVAGVNGNQHIARLVRPNERDDFKFEGDVDIYHPHEHEEGGDHDHDYTDPKTETQDPSHLHPAPVISGFVENGLSDGRSNFTHGCANCNVSGTYENTIWFNNLKKDGYSATITINTSTNLVGNAVIQFIELIPEHGTTVLLDNFGPQGQSGAITINAGDWIGTGFTNENYRLRVRTAIVVSGGGTCQVKYSQPLISYSAPVDTSNYQFTDLQVATGGGEVKTGYQDTTGKKIKAKDDVKEIEPGQEERDVRATLEENASRSVRERFDLTEYIEAADFDWINDRIVQLNYVNKNTGENPEIIITWIGFELEYRQKQIKTTDNITCEVVGSIPNRPDKVIDYLLTEKAGVPVEKLGSVYRGEGTWNDDNIWDDLIVWIDEGQQSDVPQNAYFKQAAAWFDYYGYEIDGIIDGSLSVKDAIEKITWQTRSKLLWQGGKAKLVVGRKTEDWLFSKSLETDLIQLKSLSAKRSEVDKIVNKINLYHTLDRLSEATGTEQYSATSYIDDGTSIEKHGERVDDSMWMFDLVRKQSMADHIADYYIWLLGETTVYYSLNAYLDSFELEKDDYIKINSYKFEILKDTPVVIRELRRIFGSGKNRQINLLNIVGEAIRRKHFLIYPPIEDNTVFASDAISLSIGFNVDIGDIVNVNDNLLITYDVDIEDTQDVTDSFGILADFNPKDEDDVATLSDTVSFNIEMRIEDEVFVFDDLFVAQELCFATCGFGSTDAEGCPIPFGSRTIFRPSPSSNASPTDTLSFKEESSLSDEAVITENLVISDGFGCRIGDGFAVTPFGC